MSAQFNAGNAAALTEVGVEGNDAQSIGALHAIRSIVRACLVGHIVRKPLL